MVKTANIKVGFIGAGGNTRLRHLPGFQAIDGVDLEVVSNRSTESGQRVADEFGVARVVSDWREVVNDPAIDAVCIGTWPDMHAELTVAALAAGKHVLVEARMARNVEEAQAMVGAAAARPDLVAQIVPSPFTLNADECIRRLVADGALGELREIHIESASGATADAETPISWRQEKGISGVNTMALGIFYEPLLRWLPGDGEVLAADARIFTGTRRDRAGAMQRVEIPESLTVLGRWSDGARLVMNQSTVEVGANRGLFRLVGAKATMTFNVQTQSLGLVDHAGERKISIAERPELGWAVEAQFIASIRHGSPVELTSFATGLRYMRFTEAVWNAWDRRDSEANI